MIDLCEFAGWKMYNALTCVRMLNITLYQKHKAIQWDRYEGWTSTFTHGSWTLTWLRGAQGNNHSSEDEDDDDDDVRSHFDHKKRLHIHFFTCPLQSPAGELSNVSQPVRLCAAVHIERMVWSCALVFCCCFVCLQVKLDQFIKWQEVNGSYSLSKCDCVGTVITLRWIPDRVTVSVLGRAPWALERRPPKRWLDRSAN